MGTLLPNQEFPDNFVIENLQNKSNAKNYEFTVMVPYFKYFIFIIRHYMWWINVGTSKRVEFSTVTLLQ